MSEAKAVDVSIMGRACRVSCTDDEHEALMSAVSYLDRKMCEIRDSGKIADTERLAVMAALNIAHELIQLQQENRLLTAELSERQ